MTLISRLFPHALVFFLCLVAAACGSKSENSESVSGGVPAPQNPSPPSTTVSRDADGHCTTFFLDDYNRLSRLSREEKRLVEESRPQVEIDAKLREMQSACRKLFSNHGETVSCLAQNTGTQEIRTISPADRKIVCDQIEEYFSPTSPTPGQLPDERVELTKIKPSSLRLKVLNPVPLLTRLKFPSMKHSFFVNGKLGTLETFAQDIKKGALACFIEADPANVEAAVNGLKANQVIRSLVIQQKEAKEGYSILELGFHPEDLKAGIGCVKLVTTPGLKIRMQELRAAFKGVLEINIAREMP